jgi:hypothetical protein
MQAACGGKLHEKHPVRAAGKAFYQIKGALQRLDGGLIFHCGISPFGSVPALWQTQAPGLNRFKKAGRRFHNVELSSILTGFAKKASEILRIIFVKTLKKGLQTSMDSV